MKKLMAVILSLALVIGCIPNSQGVVKASDSSEPAITYNDAVMNGDHLPKVADGDYGNGYVSEDDPDLSGGKQYIQFAWAQEVDYNLVTLYSQYCGTANTQGQAPTKWKIQTSVDGETYADVAKVTAEWAEGDDVQSKSVSFTSEENYKYMRIVILDAKLDWEHYAITEIDFATKNTNIGNFLIFGDSYSTFEGYIPEGNSVWYQDGGREGNDVTNVEQTWWKMFENNTNANLLLNESYSGSTICNTGYDGAEVSSTSFIGRFDKLVANEYFEENTIDTVVIFGGTNDSWAGSPIGEPVYSDWDEDDKKAVLPAFCYLLNGIKDNVPNAKIICIINDGLVAPITDGMGEICKIYNVDCVKLSGIDKQDGHPSVEGMVQVEEQLRRALTNEVTITYNNDVMSGMHLLQVADGDYTTGYISEGNPNLSGDGQYIQFAWTQEVNYNSVTLYSQYCGTANTQGQAPTKWKIQTSVDGETYTDVAEVTAEWAEGDDVQSKSVSFTSEENYKYMRIVILDAKLDWQHYVISEIEFTTKNAGTNEGVYVDNNGTTQYAKAAATITYSDAMSGNGLLQVADGNYETTYVSEDNPNMSNQYIQFTWNEPIDINLVTLYSQYCGTDSKDGQAPTKWTIQVSKDGTTYSDVCDVTKEWYDNDNVQSANKQFALQEDVVGMRLVVKEAKLDWGHYAIGEVEIGQTASGFTASDITGVPGGTGDEGNTPSGNVGVYEDANNTTQYAKAAATITYSDGMSGNGLLQVADGNYETTYVSEDNPNMSNQYIQFTWNEPIDINLVTLYSQYCGTDSKDGQAPTKWTIQVSKDGTTYSDVCEVSKEWYSNDDLQSANKQFALQEDVVGMRLVIKEANLDWKHYVISEVEIGQTKTGFTPSDITGTISDSGVGGDNTKIYEDANGTKQYAKAADITYSNSMSGQGLLQVADGNYTTTYVSEDNPDMKNQYIQFAWNEPVDINMVTLYAQYCGTKYKDGQAPTAWTIQVSKDGTNFTEVCKVSKKWRSNDNLQSRSTQFDLQEDIVAVRIVITEAKLDWNHYAISEIEIGQAEAGFVASDLTGIGTGTSTSTKAPQTGDASSPVYWMAMMAFSLAGVCVYTYKRKKY